MILKKVRTLFEPFLFLWKIITNKQNKKISINHMKIIKLNLFAFFLFILASLFSCSSDKQEEKAMQTEDSIEPSDEDLLQIGIQKLEKWVGFWKAKGTDFGLKNFEPKQEHQYEVVEWPGENILSEDNPLREYQIPNPVTHGVVDIYDYKMVVDPNLQVDFNPDAEVVYYKGNGMRERLLFIGPSGLFEDAVWISETHLMVSGHIQKEDGYVPVIWMIIPENHTYIVYENKHSTRNYTSESFLKEKLIELKFLP